MEDDIGQVVSEGIEAPDCIVQKISEGNDWAVA